MGKVTEQMIAGGIDLVQLRAKARSSAEIAKAAAELHCLTLKRSIPLIINDHPEIARVVSAEGVHVGQDDPAISEVREIAGPDRMVGKSTHNVDQAIRAFQQALALDPNLRAAQELLARLQQADHAAEPAHLPRKG